MIPAFSHSRIRRSTAGVAALFLVGSAVIASGALRPELSANHSQTELTATHGSTASGVPLPNGRIEITVTDGPGGAVVPAMVSPRFSGDGKYYAPENPVDLTGQWDAQGHSGPERRPDLGTPFNVPSWCTQGTIAVDAKAGAWEVLIRRGIEYVPHTEKIDVLPGKTVTTMVALRRWVDMRQRGWWNGDDHVHAQILSDDDAQRILAWARAEDTHLINVVKMGDIQRTWFEQRGWGTKFRVIDGDTALVPGQECPRTLELGHTLALNLGRGMVRDTSKYFLYDFRFDGTREQGGLNGYAHVNTGAFFVHRDMSMNVPKEKMDFVELLQFGKSKPDLYYEFLNLGMRLTALAGSDVPWGGSIGEARAYAYTGTPEFSADAWFDAVRRGRTFVTNGPMLDLRIGDAVPGDTIKATEGQQLRVRARAWGHPRLGAPRVLELVKFGRVIRSTDAPHPPDASQDTASLELDLSIEPDDGFWIAARMTAFDDSQAHTTPIWIVREGLRPWKYDEVERLIAQRLESLCSIEEPYEKRRSNPDDPFVVQWPELEKRVAAARKIYEDLREVAAREKSQRR